MENEYYEKALAEKYILKEQLAGGTFGNVFPAIHKQLGDKRAIKILKEDHGQERKDRFVAGARALATLRHKGIVGVRNCETLNGVTYMDMDFIEGPTLEQLLAEEGSVDESKLKDIALQVASALGAAHSQDIVHRDIKPENIIIKPNGDVVLIDFDLVKKVNVDVNSTVDGKLLGTIGYIAPEVVSAKFKRPDMAHSQDIYSLGCVLYEMATGRKIFSGSAQEILNDHVNVVPEAPELANPKISSRLSHIIMKCLNKDPLERYLSMGELSDALVSTEDVPSPEIKESPRASSGFLFDVLIGLPFLIAGVVSLILVQSSNGGAGDGGFFAVINKGINSGIMGMGMTVLGLMALIGSLVVVGYSVFFNVNRG